LFPEDQFFNFFLPFFLFLGTEIRFMMLFFDTVIGIRKEQHRPRAWCDIIEATQPLNESRKTRKINKMQKNQTKRAREAREMGGKCIRSNTCLHVSMHQREQRRLTQCDHFSRERWEGNVIAVAGGFATLDF
jgi:hypothetical protein